MKKNNKGFTLVELLAVLIVLAILAFLAIRTIQSSINQAKSGIDQSTEKQILDAAEKWSIENSDKFDDTEATVSQVGLDIVFVVDISGSMKYNMSGSSTNTMTQTRYYAAANALNNAVEALKPNDKNKAGFIFYSGMDETVEVEWKAINQISSIAATSGKINIYYTSGSASSITVSGGTNTQKGFRAAKSLFNRASGDGTARIPVVILVTDGEPTFYMKSNTQQGGDGSTPTGIIGRELIKEMISTRSTLKSKYNVEPFIYTIGIGVTSGYGRFVLDASQEKISELLDSSYVACPASNGNTTNCSCSCRVSSGGGSHWGGSTCQDSRNFTKSQIAAYDLYDFYIKTTSDNYDVIDKSFAGNMSADELNQIFVSIAQQINDATKVETVCVSVQQLADRGYLSKSDIKLNSGQSMKDTFVIASFNEHTNQYAFSIARTDDQIAACRALASNSN